VAIAEGKRGDRGRRSGGKHQPEQGGIEFSPNVCVMTFAPSFSWRLLLAFESRTAREWRFRGDLFPAHAREFNFFGIPTPRKPTIWLELLLETLLSGTGAGFGNFRSYKQFDFVAFLGGATAKGGLLHVTTLSFSLLAFFGFHAPCAKSISRGGQGAMKRDYFELENLWEPDAIKRPRWRMPNGGRRLGQRFCGSHRHRWPEQ